jgi:hypothetical protein
MFAQRLIGECSTTSGEQLRIVASRSWASIAARNADGGAAVVM